MIVTLLRCAEGAGLYLLVAVAATLCGLGLLRVLRLRGDTTPTRSASEGVPTLACASSWCSAELALAGVIALIAATLVPSLVAAVRLPLRPVLPLLWAAAVLLGGVGLTGLWRRRPPAGAWLVWLTCLMAPVLAMPLTFGQGLLESADPMNMDGWLHLALSQYVRDWGRNPYSGADPLMLLGDCWRDHRFASFSVLATMSPLGGGDVMRLGGVFQAWTLFSLGSAAALFWLARGHGSAAAAAGAALTVVSGWTATVVWGGWLEPGMALAFAPALAAPWYLYPASGWRRWVLLGALAAALAYTYPEALPLPIGCAGLAGLERLWVERVQWRRWIRGVMLALTVALLLLLPALTTLVPFALAQSRVVYVHNSSGTHWLLGGLAELSNQPSAFWGLGGETFARPSTLLTRAAGCILTVLLFLGVVRLACRNLGLAAAALICPTLAAIWIVILKHPYIAFKALTLSWWLLVYAVGIGAAWLCAVLPSVAPRRLALTVLAVVLLGLGARVAYKRAPFGERGYADLAARHYRSVAKVKDIVGSEPVLVHVYDRMSNQLAAYYLHDCNLYQSTPQGWFTWIPTRKRLREAAPAPAAETRFVLTDPRFVTLADGHELGKCGHVVWQGGPYQLWQLDSERGPQVALLGLDPLVMADLDAWRGTRFWVGNRGVDVYLLCRRAGMLLLSATATLGPGAPTCAQRRLQAEVNGEPAAEYHVGEGEAVLRMPVRAGVNRVMLRCPDPPENFWRRPEQAIFFLIGLANIRLTLDEEDSSY
jgi:hypothetical protein